ncbi:condensation domain-containing protein, partial [Paraburkholderia phenoliruptrix]|uniref:condensation domain-containing protein n=3 Tax=Pseudomonadota TaxID=1224 RepID=UPI001CB77C70
MNTFAEILSSRAAEQPERLAYRFWFGAGSGPESLTYAGLHARALAMAAALRERCQPGDRALVMLPPGLAYLAALFGCFMAGVVAAPLYAATSRRRIGRLSDIIVDADPRVLISDAMSSERIRSLLDDLLPGRSFEWIAADRVQPADDSSRFGAATSNPFDVSRDSLALLQYTSGSTGSPKGVQLTHGNLIANSAMIAQAFGCDQESRGVIWLPPYHDMGLIGGLLQPMFSGFECVLFSPETFLRRPLNWLQAISDFRATHSGGPNFAYALCAERITDEEIAGLDLSCWQVAFNGAERVRAETLDQFSARFGRAGFRQSAFLPCYGLAEATLIVSGGPAELPPSVLHVDAEQLAQANRVVVVSPDDGAGPHDRVQHRRLVGAGRLLAGAHVVVAAEDGTLRAEREVGEIYVAGESVSPGYWQSRPEGGPAQPFRTFAAFPGTRYLASGDLGFVSDGELFIAGRSKDVIVMRGRNLYPEDLEATVASCDDALRTQACVAFASGEHDERLIVAVEWDGRRQAAADLPRLRKSIFEAFGASHGMQPDVLLFVKLGALPLTSSGKVQRWAARRLFDAGQLVELPSRPEPSNPAASPTGRPDPAAGEARQGAADSGHDPLEARALALVTEVGNLGNAPARLSDTLAGLGFDSLKALQLTCQLEALFGIDFAMAELLDDCTVAHLVERVRRDAGEKERGGFAADAAPAGSETFGPAAPIPSAPDGTIAAYPLSPAQQSLWFLHTLSPDSSAYNVSLAFRLSGALSLERLQAALDHIVERHAVLRTVYRAVGEHLYQCVLPVTQTAIRHVDTSGWSAKALDDATSNEAAGPFNLRDGPIFRLTAYGSEAGDDTVLQIVVHHIAVDFWSLVVMIKELSHIYDALSGGRSVQLPPLTTSYAEHAGRRLLALERAAARRSRDYWRERFADAPEPLNFPTDRPRARTQTYVGEALPFKLDALLARRLKELAEATGVTLHMLLLAVFQVLLYRYTDQTDVTIGVPSAGRDRSDLHHLIGYFVNPIPVRCVIDLDATFRDHLSSSKSGFLRDLGHADHPFAQIVSDVLGHRDSSIHPLYQVMFVFQQSHLLDDQDIAALVLGEGGVEFRGEQLRFESHAIRQRMSAFDFHVSMARCGDTLIGSVQYNTDLFDRSTIERLTDAYVRALESVVEQPDCRVSEIALLDAPHRRALIEMGRAAASPAGVTVEPTITALFEAACAAHADAIAVSHDLQTLTYGALKAHADRLAAFLMDKGAQPQRPIGIVMERSAQTVVAMLAVLKCGCPYLLFDTRHPFDRQVAMLRDASAQWLLCSIDNLERAEALMWACDSVRAMVCVDGDGAEPFEVAAESDADRDLWDYVADGSSNEIQASGWMNSYTGEYFSREEMQEYIDNTVQKLRPFLSPTTRVLEVGCGSGLTMFAVAPLVASYFGTDLSPAIIEKDRRVARERGLDNVTLAAMPAHAVGAIDSGPFDVIVMNSVVQLFSSHQYLRSVLRSCVSLLAEGGVIFVGDVMDLRTREQLLESLRAFKHEHRDAGFKTKLNWDRELFLAPEFFVGVLDEMGLGVSACASAKLGRIDNELKRYRFDIALQPTASAHARQDEASARRSAGRVGRRGARYWRGDVERMATACVDRVSDASEVAYICYTSGTTGTPKGIAVPHRGVVRLVKETDYVSIGAGDRVAHLSNLAFDAATFEIWGALLNGATMQVFDHYQVLDSQAFLSKLSDGRIDVAFVTTPLFHQAARENPAGFRTLSSLLVGGEPMNLSLVRRVMTAGAPRRLLNVYGPTENTTFSTWFDIREVALPVLEQRATVPIGRAIRGSTAYVLDRRGALVPIGMPGELCVGGKGLALGYVGRDALTLEKFVERQIDPDGPIERLYRTGDKVRWNEAGELEFLGRFDSQVKVRGFRVEPAEIEAAIQRFPRVRDASVVAERDEEGRNKLAAYVVMDHETQAALDSQQLREFLAVALPEYMIPARFVAIDEIPLTPSGKLDRRRLSTAGRDLQAGRLVRPVVTETEQAIAHIWSDVLGHAPIGRDDNFFELGGHSLMATRVVSRARAAFGLDIPLRAVFEEKTLLEFAASIDRMRAQCDAEVTGEADDVPLEPRALMLRDRAPVSFAQQRLWLLDQLYPDSNAYNVPTALKLDGRLDADALRLALTTMVARHDALRTTFDVEKGVPIQRIHSAAGVDLPLENLEPLPPGERASRLEALLTDEAATPFSLRDGPLVRFRLYRLSSESHVLQVTLHHIVSDGWSMGVIQGELTRLYSDFVGGDKSSLAPLRIQYADYAVWQRERLVGARLDALQRFWHDTLDGYPGSVALPYDYARRGRGMGPGARLPLEIDAEQTQRISALARSMGTTPFTVLISALFVTLWQYTQQQDICVGTPVAGREARDLEGLIGFFVNTIVVRGQMDPQLRFVDLVERMRDKVIDAYSHQSLPFEKIVEVVGGAGGVALSPIFQVMFALQNTPEQRLELAGTSVSVLSLPVSTAKFDLFFNLSEAGGTLTGYVEYRADLFRSSTIASMADGFLRHVARFVCAPQTPVVQAGVASERDVAQLGRWNETAVGFEATCVQERIAKQARMTPEAVALVFGDERI